MKSVYAEQLRRLQDELRTLVSSRENERRLQYWDASVKGQSYDGWRLIPRRDNGECIPFVVEIEPTCLAKIHGYDLHRFYHDPDEYLYRYLNNVIYKFKTFEDCTPLRKQVVMYLGSSFEKSIVMGEAAVQSDDWSVGSFALKACSDMQKLQQGNFFDSRAMAEAKAFYERLLELADDDLEICFQSWGRSPWGLAWHLIDPEQLLVDTMADSAGVEAFLRYLTDARKEWELARRRYCNVSLELGNLYNDEVTSPMIPPQTYETLIRPFEIELSQFYGGIKYWHSCGNTTPYQRLIDGIPDIQMVHVSPWTDYVQAAQIYSGQALEVALYGYEHVVRAQEEAEMLSKLDDIRRAVEGRRVQVRAAGIEIVSDVAQDIANVQKWIACANRSLLNK